MFDMKTAKTLINSEHCSGSEFFAAVANFSDDIEFDAQISASFSSRSSR
jgi:hypothetical protein